jgi:surface protein
MCAELASTAPKKVRMKVPVLTTTSGVCNTLFLPLKPTQKITTLFVVLLTLIGWSLPGQSGLWEPIPEGVQARRAQQEVMPDLPDLEDKTLYRLSVSKMTRLANTAPLETEIYGQLSSTVVSLPMPDGSQQRFRVVESPIMEPGLAAKFPEIKTYILKGFDQPGLNGRMMVSPYEFSAFLSSPQLQTEIIIRQVYSKDASTYVSYKGSDDPFRDQEWQCVREEADQDPRRVILERSRANLRSTYTSGNVLRIFRLAITWPGHLSEYYGYTTKAEVLAAITGFQIQINTVYERDLSVRYVFPDNMDNIIFLDDATDPFFTNGGDLSLYESQAVQRELIGTENYDVGFIYVDGGCCGARGQVCSENKELSMNQFQNLQVTCHELGHQLSATHPWAHCGNPGTGNEIGGGTSIMAYPFICGDNNIPYEGSVTFFSAYSREQMLIYIDQTVTCAQTLNTGNTAPAVSVPTSGFTIPQGTPYQLVGSATDSEGGFLTYSWEQADVVSGGDPISTVPTTGNVPLQRHFNPSTNPVRIVPSLPLILNGIDSDYERLPTYSREMNYDLYVRDNQPGAGGTAVARLTFDVDGNAGPFTVTSQSACGVLSANSAQTITWNVANTDQAPVNVSQVNILLSEDGGYTWPHTLASATANDGSEQITLPANICTDQARIKVEAVGNIFFAVNSEDFSIDDGSSNIDIPSAVLLDGIDDAVEVSNTTVGNFGASDFTIEMQFRTRTPGSVLASKRSSAFTSDKAWELQLNDNGFLEMRLIDGGIIKTIGNTNLADGQWHHVAVTRESNTLTLYVDGTAQTSGNNSLSITNDAPLRIGYAADGYADLFGNVDLSFKGEITEFRYWTSARSAMNISDKAACRLVGNEADLAIYYPMILSTCGGCSDVSASGVLDATSNGNHGYLVNGAKIVMSTADVAECPTCSNGTISLTGNPANQNVADEAQASFSVTATGNNLSFQWAVSTDGGTTFSLIPAATGQSYAFTAVSTDNGNQYKCYIANGCDVVESSAASLTVACPTLDVGTLTGETAPCQQGYFSYYVAPNHEVQSWEWTMPADWDTVGLYDNMVVVRPGNTSGNISVTATDACGNMDSESLAVTPVLVAINSQPANATVAEGNDASFTVGISNGSGNTTYQWQSSTDGGMSFQNLGTNAATLDIVQASISRDGELFRCIVKDESCLLDTTAVATLTVTCTSSAPINENQIEGPLVICGSSTITYTINPMPGATSYNWSLPNGWTGSSTNNTIVVTTNGNGGTLSVTGTNSCGTTDPSELEITASASCPGAIHLDGDDDYLTAAQNSLYVDGDMTVSFWVKPDRITGVQSLVNNGSEFEIALINGQVTYRHTIYGGGYTSGVDSTFGHTPLAIGSWHHVSIVRDVSESSFSLYLNGQLFETKAWSSAYPDTPRDNDDYPLTLGAGVGALHTFFKGALDDIQIWKEARSANQVLEDVYCTPSGSEQNLIGFFSFDQGTPNGDNTSINSFTNVATGFGNAIQNNLARTGNTSNIIDGTKEGGALTGPDNFCTPGDQLTFSVDFPGTPTVTWTLPNGWTGSSTTEAISATTGMNGGYVTASATLTCGTVELRKYVSNTPLPSPGTVLDGIGLDFSGSDDYVSVPSGNINFQNEPLTIEFWAKMPNTIGFEFFVSQGDDSENNHLLIGAIGSDVYFDFRDPSGLQATGALDTEWHHWAFVYDPAIVGPADNRFIYKDGVEVAADNFAGTIDISGAFKIGDHFDNGFEGQIDEFRLWKTARSATEIQANIYCPIECINDDIRLYLPFEDGIADGNNTGLSTTEDFSLNDFTANLVGFDLQNAASNFTTGLDFIFYEDEDGDGFGSSTIWTCASAFAKVDNNLDCDDTKPFVNPLSDEICDNGADDNCNGITDESDLAINFTGTNDSLNLGTTLGNWGTDPFTLEARIKTTKTNQFIFSKRPVCNATPPFWNIKISNDGYLNNEFISPGASSTNITYESGNLADGTWHHIAITRDANNNVRYYLDGTLIQINGQDFYFQNSDITNTDPLYVGPNICSEQFEGGALNFEGDIDEIRIWNIARSATDIDTYKDRSIPVTVSGLEAYYDFNNPNATGGGSNAGQTTVTDRTGNHPGTMTGFALSGTTSNWIDNGACDPCTVTASLTNDGPVCDGELLTFTATPGGETTYLFFQDKNGNGAYDMANNELLQNNGSNTFASDTLSNGLQIGVLINDCALAYSDPVTIPDPTLIITDPAAVESPNTVDLTDPAVTAGSDAGTFTYFTDVGLTNAIPDETAVGAGTYYILLTDANGCTASGPVTVTVNQPADNTPPTITSILRQVPLDATTDADQVTFRVTFDEDVQNVSAGDFELSGTAAGDGSVGTPATVSAGVYDITITGLISSNGTINLDIASGNDIEDLASNALGNSPGIGSEEDYTIDNTGPTTVITSAESGTTMISPFQVTITFSEAVSGFVVGDISVSNGAAGNLQTSDNTIFTVDITPSMDGLVTVDVAGAVATDAIGNDNQAASQFSITYQSGGGNNTGAALNFAVTSPESWLQVEDDPLLNFNQEISIEFWCNPTSRSSYSQIVLKADPFNWSQGWGIYIDFSGQLIFHPTGWGNRINTAQNIPLNQWTHVSATYDGTRAKIYINGTLAYDQPHTGTITPTDDPMGIGVDPGYRSIRFTGTLDEVRVWDRAITQADVTANKDCEIAGAAPNLVANYHFNQGEADGDNTSPAVNTLVDDSGNGLDGTLNGFTLNGTTSNWTAPGGVTSGINCAGAPFVQSITRQNPLDAVTDADQVTFRVSFSEDVSNVDVTDFALSGTAAGDGTVGSVSTIDAGTYDVTITGLTSSEGTINLDIAGGNDIEDGEMNALGATPAILSEEEYTINNTGPTPGAALAFAQNAGYISVPDNNSLDLTNAMTIETWVKRTGSNPNNFSALVWKTETNFTGGYALYTYQDQLEFYINGNQVNNLGTGYTLPLDTWVHVAATYDGTFLKVFVNGSQVGSDVFASNPPPANNFPVGIGSDPRYDFYNFIGEMDEVRLWNRALTPTEIMANMNCEITDAYVGLAASYQFNQGVAGGDNTNPAVNTLIDASGNGNDGTLTGFTLNGTSSNWIETGGVTSGNECSLAPAILSIVRQNPTDATTTASQVTFRVAFSEDVQNVDASDFALSGIAGLDGTIGAPSAIDASTFGITVTGLGNSEGRLNLDIAAGNDIANLSATALGDVPLIGLEEEYFINNGCQNNLNVTTLAGTAGQTGSTDGTGAAARFNFPNHVVADGQGNVYVADGSNHVIRKITPVGVVTTIAGQAGNNGHADGIGTDALFSSPQGIAIDLSGNLYVSEGGNHTIRKISPSGAVTTLAGSPGNSGTTDGTGVNARFNGPSGLDFDGANTLYVTDQGNHTIRSINAFNGAVTTLAGQAGTSGFADGTGAGATFISPRDLVFATDGNVYVASESGQTTSSIRKVTTAGVVTTMSSGNAQGVVNPNGITQGKDGLLYFTSANDNTISSLPLTGGNATVVAGSTPGSTDAIGTNAQFFVPFGIEADAFGNFYVADLVNSTIRKIGDCPINGLTASVVRQSPAVETTTATTVTFRLTFTQPISELDPTDLFVSGSTRKSTISDVSMVGNDQAVYDVTVTDLDQAVGTATINISPFGLINDLDDNRIPIPIPLTAQESYTLNGGLDCDEYGALELFVGDEQEQGSLDGTGTDARMDARRLVVADDGTVYFTDFTYHVIKKISPAGEVTLIAGQSGVSGFADGTGEAARFYNPRGLALDDQGNLYIADSRNHAIRKITPAGVVTTLAGNGSFGYNDGTGSAAQFAFPQDVALDGNGDILVADGSNRVIRSVTPSGVTTTVAGTAGQSGADDGTGAAARFNYPSGLLVADNGDAYITDRGNYTIRKMTSSGVVTTIAGQAGQSGSADGPDGVGRLDFPYDMVFDPNGDLIVADWTLFRKVTLDGDISTIINDGRGFLATGIGILGNEIIVPDRSAIYKLPICTPVVFTDCEQVGQTLEGDGPNDYFGMTAMNSDGTRMIVGAAEFGFTETGYAKVYDLIGGQWVQVGSTLTGDAPGDYFGFGVDISDDGNRIAVGAYKANRTKVYEWDGTDWVQLGTDLIGEGNAGYSVSLSSDGSRLIYSEGSFSSNRGRASVYEWNGVSWNLVGAAITGTQVAGWIGSAVNISGNGNYIVLGGYAVDANGRQDAGEVRVYEWTGAAWSQVGSSVFGTSSSFQVGYVVDISDDGQRFIAGTRNATGSPGIAQVYDFDGADWALNKTFVRNVDLKYGFDISMNNNGNRVGIGGEGVTQVFDWDGVNWTQVCADFTGANNTNYGLSELSGNGERIAIGATFATGTNGTRAGMAQVFQLTELMDVMQDPITSIRRQDPMQTVTDADEVTFRVTFSESVQNVNAADFELSGTAAGDGTVGTVAMVNGNDRIYDVTITGLTSSNGTINLDIASANDIQDGQSTPIGASPAISYEEEYTLDNALVDGAALHFGGGFNNVVRVADDPKLDGTGGYSIELWVNPDDLIANGWRSLLNKSTNTWYDGYGVATYGSTLYFYPAGWSNGTHVETGLLQAGQWTHLVFTYDGATSKIYRNGTLVSERSINRTVPTNNGQLTIGGGATGYSLYKGAMDELRFWNRALEPIEIQSYINCEIPGGFANLMANYHFNEGVANDDNTNPAVDVLPDASGNGLDGALVNFTLNGNTSNWIAPGGVVSGTECNLAFYVTSIERLNPDFQRTDADQVTFRVIFSEDVQNVDVTDFELSGTITGTPALGVPNQVSASVYDIDVTNIDEENGTLGLDIAAANNISSLANDPLGATPIVGIDETYIIDNIPPVVGSALSFDKSGQVVEVPNDASLNMTDAITVETWVYTEQYSSWDQLVMKANPGSWGGGFCLSTLNGYLDWDPLGWTGATSSYRLPLNTWTHVAGTYDGAVAKLYVNGQLISSTPMTGAIPTNTRVMSIGGDKPYGYWSLNGKMDEVRVWNRALSVNEILTYKDCEIQGAANGLVANYHFNQGIAEEDNSNPPVNTLLDDSGSDNEGFLIGFDLMGSESNWIAEGGVVSGIACNVSANPEMAVLGGSPLQVIFSGDNSPEEADGTDFGLQNTGTDTDRTFTIRNTGDGVLNLPGNPTVAFASNASGFFSVETQPVATTINPAGSDLTYVLRYSPTTEGVHTATVSIESNDDDEDPYLFTVTGVANASAFITEWTISSDATVDDRTIRIPTFGGGYNYTVDWGDDNVETNVTGFIDHTYATTGTYTVTISGDFPQLFMNGRHDTPYRNQFKLTKIKQWGDQEWRTMDRAFADCRNLEITATDAPDLSQMTNMFGMFQSTGDLGNPDLTGWNTSTITNMQNVFWKSAFNGDVSTWDVSNVTNMQGLFASSQFTGDISGWTTTSLQNANYMFSQSSFNGDLSNWTMSQVTSMIHMFSSNSVFNQGISMWTTGNVTNMAFMFYRARAFNQPLNDWDVSSVTNFVAMFKEATAFNQPLDEWQLTNAENLGEMFASATAFNQDISMWTTGGVTRMNGLLNNARSFDQDLGGLDITGLTAGSSLWPALSNTAMSLANYDATLIGWAAQNVPNGVQIGSHGLQYCQGYDARQDLVNNHGWVIVGDTYAPDACPQDRPFITTWTTTVNDPTISIITDIRYNTYDFTIDWGDGMVQNNVNGTIMHTYTDHSQPHEVKITGTFPAFATAGYSWPFDRDNARQLATVKQWGDIGWESFRFMFTLAENMNITATDAPDLSKVTNMRGAFSTCRNLNADLNHWDVSKVTNMTWLFERTISFNGDISRWDVSNVTDMRYMFSGASSFNQDIGSWDVSSVANMTYVFLSAFSFDQNLGGWDFSSISGSGLNGMLYRAGLSTSNYDATLIGWADNPNTPDNLSPVGVDGLTYCAGEAAIATLEGKGWSFSGHSKDIACPSFAPDEEVEEEIFTFDNQSNTATATKQDVRLSLFPNPAQSEVTITVQGPEETGRRLLIFDPLGKLVWSQEMETESRIQLTLGQGTFPSGLYTVTLQSSDGILSQRLLITR